jgi:hypothetical protein
MRTPAAVHCMSESRYPEKISEWEYPKNYIVKYVTHTGAIRASHDKWIFVTTALMWKNVGLEELGNHIYRLYFRQFFLGYLDSVALKVHDVMKYNSELNV